MQETAGPDGRSDTDTTAAPDRLRRRRIAVIAALAACALAVTSGAFAAGVAVGAPRSDAGAAAPVVASGPSIPPSETPTPTPTVPTRSAPLAQVVAAPLRDCSVAGAASDGRLAQFQAAVLDASTGETLYSRGGDAPNRAASVMKVLTSAAALDVLGPDFQLETRVVRGADPGTVVLIGGGDVTLSRASSSVYQGAPRIADLAEQTRAAWGSDVPITTVVTDASYFGGDVWHPTWKETERTQGYMPQITALMVDGDRQDPSATNSARSTDPVGRAGQAFADALGTGAAVVSGVAPAGAQQLAVVRSQPVSTLVQQALMRSDNAIAEALARVTAIRAGGGNDFGSIDAALVRSLGSYGIPTGGIRIVDGSGLSDDNAIPPDYLTRLFVKIANRERALGAVYDGLPVAGRTGTLAYADRFSGASSRAAGSVHAKTGWIDTGYALAGVIDASDGTRLTFAIYALGNVTPGAKQAIDALTAAFYDCGADLSNS